MEPVSTSARLLGSVATGAINRYRPVGVVRLGSLEDRGQAYRRLLDARAHFHTLVQIHYATSGAEQFTIESHLDDERVVQAIAEALAALDGVRLCAPEYVIRAAERMCYTVPEELADEDDYKDSMKKHFAAFNAFLDAARHDLNYRSGWWQFLRRWKESAYRKELARKATAGLPATRQAE